MDNKKKDFSAFFSDFFCKAYKIWLLPFMSLPGLKYSLNFFWQQVIEHRIFSENVFTFFECAWLIKRVKKKKKTVLTWSIERTNKFEFRNGISWKYSNKNSILFWVQSLQRITEKKKRKHGFRGRARVGARTWGKTWIPFEIKASQGLLNRTPLRIIRKPTSCCCSRKEDAQLQLSSRTRKPRGVSNWQVSVASCSGRQQLGKLFYRKLTLGDNRILSTNPEYFNQFQKLTF